MQNIQCQRFHMCLQPVMSSPSPHLLLPLFIKCVLKHAVLETTPRVMSQRALIPFPDLWYHPPDKCLSHPLRLAPHGHLVFVCRTLKISIYAFQHFIFSCCSVLLLLLLSSPFALCIVSPAESLRMRLVFLHMHYIGSSTSLQNLS